MRTRLDDILVGAVVSSWIAALGVWGFVWALYG
jgi:hypothetical protein